MAAYRYKNGKLVYDRHYFPKHKWHTPNYKPMRKYNINKKKNIFTNKYSAPPAIRAHALAAIRRIRASRKFRKVNRPPINQFRRNLRLSPVKRMKRRY